MIRHGQPPPEAIATILLAGSGIFLALKALVGWQWAMAASKEAQAGAAVEQMMETKDGVKIYSQPLRFKVSETWTICWANC